MITLKDARANFIALELASFLHWLPFNFDRRSGRIWLKSKSGWTLFTINFLLVLLFELNFIYTLLEIKITKRDVPFSHFANHVIFIFSMGSDLCRAATYFSAAEDIALVFNELYYKPATGTTIYSSLT